MMKRYYSCILLLIWVVLVGYSFASAYSVRTGMGILSPWQVISPTVVYLVAGSFFCLGLLIAFLALPARILLLMCIAQTFLIHSFTSASHQFFYGADGWRHIASIERISSGLPLYNAATTVTSASFFHQLNPGVVAYSHLWLLLFIAKSVTGLPLISLMAWVGPIVWSLIMPGILYALGTSCTGSKKTGLLLAFGGLFPYAFIAGGSFALPNSLGFVFFVPSIWLLTKRLESEDTKWLYWLLGYGFFLLTGYTLYAIVFLLLWALAEIVRRSVTSNNRTFLAALCVVLMAGSVPLLELITGYSQLPISVVAIAHGAQQAVGNLSGFYLVTGPRPHAIATGNILLNQTPAYAFVPNILTEGRYWLMLIVCFVWIVVGIAIYRGVSATRLLERWLALSAVGLMGMYGIGRYVLVGEQILSRRLDMIIALFVLLLVYIEGRKRLLALHVVPLFRRYAPWGLLVLFSAFGAAVMSLGPVDRAMNADEYDAANYVWSVVHDDPQAYCVLSETYPLLALEAISAKRIVGGGFPINQYFGQKEREELYARLLKKESVQVSALRATNTRHCFAIAPVSSAPPEAHQFGALAVWPL